MLELSHYLAFLQLGLVLEKLHFVARMVRRRQTFPSHDRLGKRIIGQVSELQVVPSRRAVRSISLCEMTMLRVSKESEWEILADAPCGERVQLAGDAPRGASRRSPSRLPTSRLPSIHWPSGIHIIPAQDLDTSLLL